MQQEFDSRVVEAALGLKPSTLRYYADALGAAPHGQKGKTRLYSFKDMILIEVAVLLSDSALNFDACAELAIVMAPEIERLLADPKAKAFVLAWPDPAGPAGLRTAIYHDPQECIAAIDVEDPPIIASVRKYLDIAINDTVAQMMRAPE